MGQLRPGNEVKILDGPFAEFEGIVQDVNDNDVTVVIKIFERETPVHFKMDQLEWEGEDSRPVFQQKLEHLLDAERTRGHDNWWMQRLAQPEDNLATEYREFLQFCADTGGEHTRRREQLQHDFSQVFTDALFAEEGNRKLKELWPEYLERWDLEQKYYDQPLTPFEEHCLKRLSLIDNELDPNASARQSWEKMFEDLKALESDGEMTPEELAEDEAGWREDFERGYLSPEHKLLLTIWGIEWPSEILGPYGYRALLREAAEERRQRAEYANFRQQYLPPADELAALRSGARQQAEAQREPVQAFFQQTYQLTLPDHVFTFWAFWLGLTSVERGGMDWRLDDTNEIMTVLGISPGGIFDYFDQAGRERVPQAGLDHRLNDRFYCDPPEFFTALFGDTDGLHFGLWYDNPHRASAFVTSYYSRDGGGIGCEGQTLLEAVRKHIEWAEFHSDSYSKKEEERKKYRLSIQLLRDAVMEYETANRPERGEAYVFTYGKIEGRIPICNELGVVVPPAYKQPPERDMEAIYQAIRTDAPEVKQWVDEALEACAQGQPALALVLGHDLHWLSDDQQERKDAAHLLLTSAYEVLGYKALAEITTIHHRYRDLPNVDIYTYPYDFSI